MRLGIELRYILFPLIILEMFLQLDWSPPVVNSWLDMIWKGTHLSIRSCSWQCTSEQKPSLEVEVIVRRAQIQDCIKAQIWGMSGELKVPKNTASPSFLNGESLEPPRLFLVLATWPNWAIGREGPWSGRWPRTQWSLWQSSRVLLWKFGNLPEGQPTLQPSTNQAFQ
jgi:hypothetical protein